MKPEELLEIAKQTIAMNELQFALTGSLMCYARGIKTRREPTDIDLIGELSDMDDLKVPEGFIYHDHEGGGSDLNSVVFRHKETGVKIDFLAIDSEEFEDTEDESLVLADLQEMISIKISYSKHDKHIESRQKHIDDLLELVSVMSSDNYTRFCNLIETK